MNKIGVFHRDIKPQNALYNMQTKTVKIIDWGLADFYSPNTGYSIHVGTRYYKAPELLLNYQFYHYSVDIWSAGCIFYSMLTKKEPYFKADDDSQMLLKIVSHFGTNAISKFAKKYRLSIPITLPQKEGKLTTITDKSKEYDLLFRMLAIDPEERILACEALKHDYFKEK